METYWKIFCRSERKEKFLEPSCADQLTAGLSIRTGPFSKLRNPKIDFMNIQKEKTSSPRCRIQTGATIPLEKTHRSAWQKTPVPHSLTIIFARRFATHIGTISKNTEVQRETVVERGWKRCRLLLKFKTMFYGPTRDSESIAAFITTPPLVRFAYRKREKRKKREQQQQKIKINIAAPLVRAVVPFARRWRFFDVSVKLSTTLLSAAFGPKWGVNFWKCVHTTTVAQRAIKQLRFGSFR
jgi:hypothetical protein